MPAVPRLHGRLGQGGSGEQWDQAQILDTKTQAKVKMIWTQQAMGQAEEDSEAHRVAAEVQQGHHSDHAEHITADRQSESGSPEGGH